jgi:hypothetical protein
MTNCNSSNKLEEVESLPQSYLRSNDMTAVQKICYVLTSDGTDSYADMNLVSAWSVRYSNPQVKIILLSDTGTRKALEARRHPILTEMDEFQSVEVPSASASFKNRYIKTSLRRRIEGPFLFLDADTIVRGNLMPVFETKAALAGVPNHSGTGAPSEIPKLERRIFKELDWTVPPNYYVNGGVLFFSKHPDAYTFCDLWHELWVECSRKTGRHFDQVALNKAINDSRVDFTWINHGFNAQVHARPSYAWGAIIWHIYLSGHHASPKTVLDVCLDRMRNGRPVDRSFVAKMCRREHPWLINNPIDRIAVKRFRRHKKLLTGTDWEQLWLADEHLRAIRQLMGNKRRVRDYARSLLGSRASKADSKCRVRAPSVITRILTSTKLRRTIGLPPL